MTAEQAMDRAVLLLKRENAIADTLDPALPSLTRLVMANDLRQAEDARAVVAAGEMGAERSLVFVGSYARISHLAWLVDEGHLPLSKALEMLPELWPGSDPDDTDERFLELWRLAHSRNGGYVRDGKALPRKAAVKVWRGQRRGDPLGCAWSLREEVAEKFANGASFRVPIRDGEIIEATVPRGMVLAYLTARGEDEVIIDPKFLSRVET